MRLRGISGTAERSRPSEDSSLTQAAFDKQVNSKGDSRDDSCDSRAEQSAIASKDGESLDALSSTLETWQCTARR